MKCPNCGAEVGKFDLSPNCKNCGVNLFYVSQQKLLTEDIKRTELEFAAFHMWVECLKRSFIKGALPICRIVFTVLCVAALLVPFGSVKLDFKAFSDGISFWGVGLYQAYSDGALPALINFAKLAPTSDIAIKSFIMIGAMVAILLVDVVILVAFILSFTNIQKTAKIMARTACAGMVFSVFATVWSIIMSNAAVIYPGNVKASFGPGGLVCLAMFVAVFIINMLFIKKNIHPEYKEIDVKRREMNKKVKKGEVRLADLPIPVFTDDEAEEGGADNE